MKTRLEADEVAAQLERCDKENKMLKDEMNKEIEAVLSPLSSLPGHFPCLMWLTRVTDLCLVLIHSTFLSCSLSGSFSMLCFLVPFPLWFDKKPLCWEEQGGLRWAGIWMPMFFCLDYSICKCA